MELAVDVVPVLSAGAAVVLVVEVLDVVVGGGAGVVVGLGAVVIVVVTWGVDVVDPDPDPDAGVVVVDPGVVDVDVLGLELGGFVSRPLLWSAVSISCCTVATCEATAAGVPPAPSEGSAFSCFRSFSSVATSVADGWDFSVTTSWSASAVVVHAGQS